MNPVETYIRAGTYARKPTLPYTPGTDVAGVVETIGEGVTAVKVRLINTAFNAAERANIYLKCNMRDVECYGFS